MNRKNEHIIFFSVLLVLGVVVVGGISYFKTQATSDGLLADVSASIPTQSPMPTPTTTVVTVETIPTSTIITTTSTPIVPIVPLTLPYSFSKSTATSTYWPKSWGSITLTDNSLNLIPDPSYHGANSFLNGASSWSNYAVSANVSPLMGGWFDIVARVSNNTQNFVYCEFGSNGTEVIERVNGIDTQLAATSASTTDVVGATENFGINVYGNDIGCSIANQEVIGAHVQNDDEAPTGGIGFVIFRAPPQQQQVAVSDIYVSALPTDSITIPFPIPVVTPPPAPKPTPVASTTPVSATTSTTPIPTPPPTVTTTTKTLPYATNTFSKSQGWSTYWGNFTIATDSLTVAATTQGTSAGVLLSGTTGWDNYNFSATLDWVKGETFGLYARYTDAQNYVLCYYDEPNLGTVEISLEQHIDGREYTLEEGYVNGYNQWGGTNITAAIDVYNTQMSCSFNGSSVSSVGSGFTVNPPYSGKIGFTTWDPKKNNSEIIVNSVSAQEAVN